MKCPYCQSQMIATMRNLTDYTCSFCSTKDHIKSVEVGDFGVTGDKVTVVQIVLSHKDKDYLLTLNLQLGNWNISNFEDGLDLSFKEGSTNITPDNAYHKLRTAIVFS